MAILSPPSENTSRRANAGRRLLLRALGLPLAGGVVGGVVTLAGAAAGAQPVTEDAAVLERRVKAVFVFKFAGFVDWPGGVLDESDATIQIAVMGEDAVAQDIADAAGSRTVDGHPVQARRVERGAPLEGVHILFIRDSAFRNLGEAVGWLQPQPMLVVTESPGALAQGSVINFVVDDGRVRFDISLDAAERRGLKLSSRLITVARNVIGKPQ